MPPVGLPWLGLTCFWQRPDLTVDRPDHWPSSVGTVPKSGNSTAGFVVSLPELEASFGQRRRRPARFSLSGFWHVQTPLRDSSEGLFTGHGQNTIGWRSSSIRCWWRAGRAETWGRSPFDDAATRARQTVRAGKRSWSAWRGCFRGCVARQPASSTDDRLLLCAKSELCVPTGTTKKQAKVCKNWRGQGPLPQ